MMRKSLIETSHLQLSMRRQAKLLKVNRIRLSPKVREITAEDLELCREIEKLHFAHYYYGSWLICKNLVSRDFRVSRGKVRRWRQHLGLVATYPKLRTSLKSSENRVYPYLLRDIEITSPDQVWCSGITYAPMRRDLAYFAVIIDWYSRAVLGWRISNILDADFCLEALQGAHKFAGCWPEIMNTDQCCQYTSEAWTRALEEAGVRVSMDGKGRRIDNGFVERLWRSLKYEDIYLREYFDLIHVERGVGRWLDSYNHERGHQSLDHKIP